MAAVFDPKFEYRSMVGIICHFVRIVALLYLVAEQKIVVIFTKFLCDRNNKHIFLIQLLGNYENRKKRPSENGCASTAIVIIITPNDRKKRFGCFSRGCFKFHAILTIRPTNYSIRKRTFLTPQSHSATKYVDCRTSN